MRPLAITSRLAAQVLEIAREAGAVILTVYDELRASGGGADEVLLAYKPDASPLTRADLLSHQLISHRLAVLTPHVSVVSEEDPQSLVYRRPQGDFWLVDPLDGTKEFLARNDEFTVNIALVRKGQSVLGVVLAPALGQAYWGGIGLGAFRQQDGQVASIQVAKPVA